MLPDSDRAHSMSLASALTWIVGSAAIALAAIGAMTPWLRNNEATLFVYDLFDDVPMSQPAVLVSGLLALVAAYALQRSWLAPIGILSLGLLFAAVGLVVGHFLFVPWVGK